MASCASTRLLLALRVCDATAMRVQDVALQVHSYNVLLHLCAGGNQADEAAKRVYPEHSAEARALSL